MELVLQGLHWEACLIYIDDIIVFGKTFEEHLTRLEQVLSRISKFNLKLQPDKCHLFQQEVEFLGHVVSGEGTKPYPHNIAKIKCFPTLTNVTMVRGIIGMGSYYRKFINGFANLVRPLVELTKSSKEFIWTAECQKAFDDLKAGTELLCHE